MKYKKITKEEAEKLKKGDFVFIYPGDGDTKDEFDEKDIGRVSITQVDSNTLRDVILSIGFSKDGNMADINLTTLGTTSKKVSEIYESGRYWIKDEEGNN